MNKYLYFLLVFLFILFLCPVAAASDFTFDYASDDPIISDGYLPPDQFFALYGDDYEIQVVAVQSSPNTPVTSASGLKGIMINLLGPYDPPITQLRYQSNTSTNYTYVNDIQPDYVWMCSCAIFAICLWSVFAMGGALIRRT